MTQYVETGTTKSNATGSTRYSPLVCWLLSLLFAVLVFFPRAYASNISSWRDSKTTFERMVSLKHGMLKAAGIFLTLGALALLIVMGVYLAD